MRLSRQYKMTPIAFLKSVSSKELDLIIEFHNLYPIEDAWQINGVNCFWNGAHAGVRDPDIDNYMPQSELSEERALEKKKTNKMKMQAIANAKRANVNNRKS